MSITNAFFEETKRSLIEHEEKYGRLFRKLIGILKWCKSSFDLPKCFHLNYDLFKNLIFDQFRRKIQAKFLKNQELALSLKTVLKLSWLRKQTWSRMASYKMICIFVGIRTTITKILRIVDFRDFPLFQILALMQVATSGDQILN